MELQRILARDARSATEQALRRFGPNVFVISNHRVAGQTELVVAVDVQASPPEDDDVVAAPKAAQATPSFEARLHAVMTRGSDDATHDMEADSVMEAPSKLSPSSQPQNTQAQTPHTHHNPAEGDRDWIRSREIVATVREEIAALRQEFRLSQQAMLWQAQQSWPEALQPLVQGLSEAAVPASLRALLLDGLREETHLGGALDAITRQLVANMPQGHEDAPLQGVHVLAGPSGGGKTLMAARLARHFLQQGQAEQVAVISFRDNRAGAWPQLQTLCAQLGIDAYRAKDAEVLRVLLDELSTRTLVLIDTPGVQLKDNLAELHRICPQAHTHMVMPADASSVTLQRVLADHAQGWRSLMVTKLDESSAPWPLLQCLMQPGQRLPLSVASSSDSLKDDLLTLTPAMLADLAVAQWMPQPPDAWALTGASTPVRQTELQVVHG